MEPTHPKHTEPSAGQPAFRSRLAELSRNWIQNGLPDRSVVHQTALELEQWKQANAVDSLWSVAPSMYTATIDDGSGLGLHTIEHYGRLIGLQVRRLGLGLTAHAILAACHQAPPDLLGLTVLWGDSHVELAQIGNGLPQGTSLIAGGPAFRYDPDLAEACKVFYVARNVAYFIDFLLNWTP